MVDLSTALDYSKSNAADLYNAYKSFQQNPVEVSARELKSEVEFFKSSLKRNMEKSNLKNNTGLGKLEDSIVNRLKDWDKNI